MTDGEPAVLRNHPTLPAAGPPAPSPRAVARPTKQTATEVFVAGFWQRITAAAIDCAIVLPAALAITIIASRIAGVHLPPSSMRLRDIDLWIDLAISTDPALLMGLGLFGAIGWTYLLVFHIVRGCTIGMRIMKIKVIDIYGDPPSPRRSVARCTAYFASAATLFLGFLWVGFDREKRGLHDWMAGTYVIRV